MSVEFEGRSIKMFGPVSTDQMQCLRAEVREGLGQITEIDVEFLSAEMDTKLEDILGQIVSIEIECEDESKRYFTGHCIEVFYEGTYEGQAHHVASLRAWPWMMTQTTDCRIFQDKNAMEIITELFGEYGFSDYEDKTQGVITFQRPYCVQYNETDWGFVYRLMVEEGLYFYFDYTKELAKLIIVAAASSHENIPIRHQIHFYFKEDGYRRRDDHIFDWRHRETLRTGKVTAQDFNFQTPTADLTSEKAEPKGKHSHKDYEEYRYARRYPDTTRGNALVEDRMLAYVGEHARARGITNVRHMAVGYRFEMGNPEAQHSTDEGNHPRQACNRQYLVTEAIHQLQIETDYDKGELEESLLGERVVLDLTKNKDPYRCTFRTIPHDVEFRLPYSCPRPKIHGLQTAIVQGPSGEEIYTDCYARVKVKFHWDRNPAGLNPEALTCWIRKAEPWTGQSWGMQWVPRMGQEVVVAFEEGDPDRPMIVGMLFNNAKPPPTFRGLSAGSGDSWTCSEEAATTVSQDDDGNSFTSAMPANKNLMGWTTRSTKQGSATTFHELVFDDTKDSEFVRLQSERDYKEIIKNNAHITIGQEHADPGDYTMVIKNHRHETVQEGDHTFTVAQGVENYTVEGDRTVTMNANHIEEIATDQTSNIGSNQTIDVGSEISVTAGSSITLTCGGSSITMDSSSITLSSTTIEVSGSAEVTVSAPTVNVEGSGMVKVQGGAVKIN